MSDNLNGMVTVSVLLSLAPWFWLDFIGVFSLLVLFCSLHLFYSLISSFIYTFYCGLFCLFVCNQVLSAKCSSKWLGKNSTYLIKNGNLLQKSAELNIWFRLRLLRERVLLYCLWHSGVPGGVTHNSFCTFTLAPMVFSPCLLCRSKPVLSAFSRSWRKSLTFKPTSSCASPKVAPSPRIWTSVFYCGPSANPSSSFWSASDRSLCFVASSLPSIRHPLWRDL